jgi:hypothetical protein
MFDVLADFEWYRDQKGYRIVPFGSLAPNSPWKKKSAAHDDVPWIAPRGDGGDLRKYKPFASGGDVCTAFASVSTSEALVRFVNDYGPLTWSAFRRQNDLLSEHAPVGEPVPLGLANAEMFRELLQLQASGNPRNLASRFESKIAGFVGAGQVGQVELVPDSEKGLRLKVTPPTFLGALWYQLALKLSDADLRMCPLCHRVFEVGRGTGLRADAKFCCQEHKVEYFNQKRHRRKRRQGGINAPRKRSLGS